MNYRPLSLLIVGILHLFEPVTKTLFYSFLQRRTPWEMVRLEFLVGDPLHIFSYFCLFPIAGIAILAVKRWSLPVFLIIELWVFVTNMPQLLRLFHEQNYVLLSFYLWFFIVNLFYVSYLLIPRVRILYLNPKLRWWEARPRYHLELKGKLKGESVTLENISLGGVFLTSGQLLEMGREYPLIFQIHDNRFEVSARAVHRCEWHGEHGYGMQFVGLSFESSRKLRSVISTFEKENIQRRPEKRDYLHDFKEWFFGLVQRFKKLFSKIPNDS